MSTEINELIEGVRQCLEEEDRTAAWFARQAGLSRTQVVQMLDGRRVNLKASTIAKIKKVLERSDEMNTQTVDHLLGIVEAQQKTIDKQQKTIESLQNELNKCLSKIYEPTEAEDKKRAE